MPSLDTKMCCCIIGIESLLIKIKKKKSDYDTRNFWIKMLSRIEETVNKLSNQNKNKNATSFINKSQSIC
jgi:hypothetical protein